VNCELHNETINANTNTKILGLPLNLETELCFADTAQWLLEVGAEITDNPWDTVCAALSIIISKRLVLVPGTILGTIIKREVADLIFDVAANTSDQRL
jgi:hypothetical protein